MLSWVAVLCLYHSSVLQISFFHLNFYVLVFFLISACTSLTTMHFNHNALNPYNGRQHQRLLGLFLPVGIQYSFVHSLCLWRMHGAHLPHHSFIKTWRTLFFHRRNLAQMTAQLNSWEPLIWLQAHCFNSLTYGSLSKHEIPRTYKRNLENYPPDWGIVWNCVFDMCMKITRKTSLASGLCVSCLECTSGLEPSLNVIGIIVSPSPQPPFLPWDTIFTVSAKRFLGACS